MTDTKKEKNPYKPSDQAYRHLFSNPIVIHDTIAGFVGEDLANQLDFDSLEQVNPNYVSDQLARRSNDQARRAVTVCASAIVSP